MNSWIIWAWEKGFSRDLRNQEAPKKNRLSLGRYSCNTSDKELAYKVLQIYKRDKQLNRKMRNGYQHRAQGRGNPDRK